MSTRPNSLLLPTLDTNILLLVAMAFARDEVHTCPTGCRSSKRKKAGFAFQMMMHSQISSPRDLFGGAMMTQLLQIISLHLPS